MGPPWCILHADDAWHGGLGRDGLRHEAVQEGVVAGLVCQCGRCLCCVRYKRGQGVGLGWVELVLCCTVVSDGVEDCSCLMIPCWKRVSSCSTSGASGGGERAKNNDAVADANYGMTSRGAGAQCSRANMHRSWYTSLRPVSASFAIAAASLARCCACSTLWSLCPDAAPPILPRASRLQRHSAAHTSPRAID